MAFHKFDAQDGWGESFGSFEVFYRFPTDCDEKDEEGWYWQPCFPGCLPDGDMNGPFESEIDAINNAQTL